jgi:hypothetical protein
MALLFAEEQERQENGTLLANKRETNVSASS